MTATKKFDAALAKIETTIVASHETINATRAKIAEAFKTALNFAIDAGKACKMESAEIRDGIVAVFDKHVAEGHIEKSTARAYMTGMRFALDRGVMWNPSLHGAEGQIQALKDAGKKIPDSLAKKAEEMEAKARDAKHGKAHVASKETIVKSLAKALADARTLGKADWIADILDVIHSIEPSFTEPTADAK